MNPRRVTVIGRGLARTDQAGNVEQELGNGLVGVRFDGMHSIEFFTEQQLKTVQQDEGAATMTVTTPFVELPKVVR